MKVNPFLVVLFISVLGGSLQAGFWYLAGAFAVLTLFALKGLGS